MSRQSKQIRFEKAMEDLTIEVLQSGWDIDYVDNPVVGHTDGWFRQPDRKIIIMSSDKSSLESILFVTAHEVRHLQHYKLGIFKDYYREEHESSLDYFSETDTLPIGYVPPKPCVAIRAESDCNKWAVNFMKERGFHYEPESYAIRDVMGYAAFIRYQTIKRERGKAASCDEGAAFGSQKTWSQSDLREAEKVVLGYS